MSKSSLSRTGEADLQNLLGNMNQQQLMQLLGKCWHLAGKLSGSMLWFLSPNARIYESAIKISMLFKSLGKLNPKLKLLPSSQSC